MTSAHEQLNARLYHVREMLRSASDPEYVRRVWIGGEGPEVDSFAEFVCGIFDDMRTPELVPAATRGGLLTKAAASALRDFLRRIEEFLPDVQVLGHDEDVVAHPGWAAVAAAAMEAARLMPTPSPPRCEGG
jgi:hypothetical protein